MSRPAFRTLRLGLLAGAILVSVPVDAKSAESVPLGRAVQEGVAAEMTVRHVDAERRRARAPFAEGDDVEVTLRLTYADSGEPLPAAYPAVWMSRRSTPRLSDAETCKERVELLMGGSFLSQAELDLNVFYVVTLNHDGTLSVVDPLFGFGGTKLLALVSLEGPGEDWVLHDDRIFVTLPSEDKVAVVDARAWEVIEHVSVPGRPTRMALQPDGHYLWVGTDAVEDSGVTVLSSETGRVVRRIPTGSGPHEIAFDEDGRQAYVTNTGSGTVTVVDASGLQKTATITTGPEPVSLAWSPLADRMFVSHRKDGRLVVLDPDHDGWIVGSVVTEPGLDQVRFSPDGRWGFAINPETEEVHVIDAAAGRIVQTGDFPGAPDQVTFTDELAYIRHREHETILMVPLRALGVPDDPIQVIDFPGGQRPFGAAGGPAVADGIVRSPDAIAVLVAHPADETVYYYREGMAAPMGSFKNYGRKPRAVLVVDRSLQERKPGEYSTIVRLRSPGPYDASIFVQSPLLVHCFPFQVAEAPGTVPEHKVRFEIVARPEEAKAGEEARVRFRLVDESTGRALENLPDVEMMALQPPGRWHHRDGVHPLGDGLYEARLTPPSPGRYVVHVQSATAGVPFRRAAISFEVGE